MTTIRLALRMMWRDLRAGELHLLVIALALAVASLTSVGFLADRVERGLEREANQFLGGDLLLRADHPWEATFMTEARRRELRLARTILFTSMVAAGERAELAAVKVVEDPYPLRGQIRIAAAPNGPDRIAERMPEAGEVWLDERLLGALGIAVGDTVGLGLLELRVAAVVSYEADRGANFFSLLPRVVLNLADLDRSGLLVEGSRASWRLHVAGAAPGVDEFAQWARARLGRGEAVEGIESARPEVRAVLDQALRFLRLASLLAVVLASVATGLSAHRFMRRHLDACAVLRCLGARQSQVLRLVVVEFLAAGLLAAVMGGMVGAGTQVLLAPFVVELVGTDLPALGWAPAWHGVIVALVLQVGFVLPQVLRLGRVPTLRVLRRELVPLESRSAGAWAAGCLALSAIIFWIARDIRLAAIVGGGFLFALGLFAFAAWAALQGLGRMRKRLAMLGSGWRYGLAAVVRRKALSVLQISALATGLAALIVLTLVRAELLDTWRRAAPPDAPNRFVINIQPDQRAPVENIFREHGLPVPPILPMIRGRLVAINGREVRPETFENPRTRRLAEREFNLSYGALLPQGNEILSGRWHGAEATPQFSVEKGLAETFGLRVGDSVRFSVGGRAVEAPVTSIRELNWDSMRVNFFVIAAPGMLEDAPASLITSFHLPPQVPHFTADLVARLPNLSIIDIETLIAQIRSMTDRLVHVVQAVFGFSLVGGVIVLFAALQSTHDERAREFAILRTLGARNRQLRLAIVAEFCLLGGIAAVLGGIGAAAVGWGLARSVLDIGYQPDTFSFVAIVLVAALGVVAAGWLGTRRLLTRAPLEGVRRAA